MGLTRRFLFNDASWCGQCASSAHFQECIRFCLDMHSVLRKAGGGLEVGYNFTRGAVGYVPTVQEALSRLQPDQRARVRLWLDKQGPWWDRPAKHSSEEYFECEGRVVTDTALAEAAYLSLEGEAPYVVSLPDSSYATSELEVIWHQGPHGTISIKLIGVTSAAEARRLTMEAETDFTTYEALIRWAQKECRYLALVRHDLLQQLGTTFVPAVARRGKQILSDINSIAEALRSGDHATFAELTSRLLTSRTASDASLQEKNDREFKKRMRFKHPCTGEWIDCTWHAKISTGVYRIHFEWPPPLKGKSGRLFIAYFGQKLTKQ